MIPPPPSPHAPLSYYDPSAVNRVALASKEFRVFGIDSPAWNKARAENLMKKKKKKKKEEENNNNKGDDDDGGGDDDDDDGEEEEEEEVSGASRRGSNGNGGDNTNRKGSPRKGNLAGILRGVNEDDDDDDDDDESDYSSDDDEAKDDHGETANNKEEEEMEMMAAICRAITEKALADDAGGHGTAGFHTSKVENVRLLPTGGDDDGGSGPPVAVYGADLVPCHAETARPIVPSEVLATDHDTGEPKYSGNDQRYLTKDAREKGHGAATAVPRFQIRITVARAAVGVAASEYYKALFAKRREIANARAGTCADDDVDASQLDALAREDEVLGRLRQKLVDAGEGHHGAPTKESGYYVRAMLLEPDVGPREVAAAPPFELDKAQPNARPATGFSEEEGVGGGEEEGGGGANSAFRANVYTSRQFRAPGPWERANIKAYGDILLDLRKALVRVEFPVFPEGCADKTFRSVYQLNARLKSGSFATVCRGTHRATGKKIAVKCVLRKDLPPGDDAAIYDEVLILSALRHPYICPLVDFFEERECYFLVMELMSGGDLFDRIGQMSGSYTEDDARGLCRKMLESVRYCHENSVAHCDMKPKNLLLVSDDDDVMVKLADFGFATRVYEPGSLTKQCGTPFFVAPEVLMRKPYDQQSDMWSCGVIIFLLLGGDLPFMGRSQRELFRNIVQGRYEFGENAWKHVSDQAKDLVRQLLVTDPPKRLTSREAMASPWMRSRGVLLKKNNLKYTSQRLQGFNARLKLKASMIAVGSVVRMSLSVRNLKSDRSLSSSATEKKRPSFLNLPDESIEEESSAPAPAPLRGAAAAAVIAAEDEDEE